VEVLVLLVGGVVSTLNIVVLTGEPMYHLARRYKD